LDNGNNSEFFPDSARNRITAEIFPESLKSGKNSLKKRLNAKKRDQDRSRIFSAFPSVGRPEIGRNRPISGNFPEDQWNRTPL
jgi:hypothetical protein